MVLIRNDLLDCLPTPFSGKSSCEIPFATIFIFQKIHIMHSHLIPRLPRAYEMHYVISTQFISHMQIYHHAYIYITKAHKTCYAHSSSISPKISSHGLIYNYEQFNFNYSTKHIISQKYFVNTIHVNSETLGLLFMANHQHWLHFVNPNFKTISGLIHITILFVSQITTQTPKTAPKTVTDYPMGLINSNTSVPKYETDQTTVQGLNPTETSTKLLNQE